MALFVHPPLDFSGSAPEVQYIMVNDRHNITVKATVYLDDYERLTISLVPHQKYHTASVHQPIHYRPQTHIHRDIDNCACSILLHIGVCGMSRLTLM